MFGLIAIANVLIFGINMLSDFGLRQNLIQSNRGHAVSFLNTVWTVKIARGIVIWAFALVIAFGIYWMNLAHLWSAESVYSDPALPYIIAILGFTAVIDGFESTKADTAGRELLLKRLTLIEITSQLAGITMMVAWAWFDRSVWALVIGALFSDIIRTILTHTSLPGIRNRIHWDQEDFHEIFKFGKWVFVASILGFMASSGDRLVLGGLTDATTLGLYSIAFLMWSAMREVIQKITGDVAFPAFSEVVRNRPADLKKTYYKFRLPIDALSLFAAGMLFAAGDLIILILYDDRYADAGTMLQILCVTFIAVRYELVNQCFLALGKPKLLVPLTVVGILALYGLLPVGYSHYGINGALWMIVLSNFAALPLIFFYKNRYNILDIRKELFVLPILPVGYGLGLVVHSIFDRLS